MSEVKLWTALKNGDKPAYAQLYEQYAKPLLLYGRKIQADEATIEDAIHDLFVELWRYRTNLSATTSIKFYLFGALRKKLMGNIKTNIELGTMTYLENALFDISHEAQLIENEDFEQITERIRQALDQLPPRQREAIFLRYHQNFNNDQIAEIMGLTYNSSANLINKGLKRLREVLPAGLLFLEILIGI
jgi:RNA polymerase sigma factor (sigma-70 family)